MGVNGMRITYDPMFKFVFNPGTKPERLEEFISLCLGEEVKILQVIPNESGRLTEGGSCLLYTSSGIYWDVGGVYGVLNAGAGKPLPT